MLLYRFLSALVIVPVSLAAIWFGDPWFSMLIALAALLGAFEFYRMVGRAGGHPFLILGLVLTLAFVLNAHFLSPVALPLLLTMTIIAPLICVVLRQGPARAFQDWAWTVGGILYMGWLLSYFVLLRGLAQGREWTILAVFATFACDTAAYFVGRAWGRHKLAPAISPGKTWEGAVGGLLGAVVATVALDLILGLSQGYLRACILGLIIGVFAQLGDLAESLLKRSTGVKDASRLIPGHGGMLDRLDSIVFTGVIVYYYVLFI